jgi:hypothetical protein
MVQYNIILLDGENTILPVQPALRKFSLVLRFAGCIPRMGASSHTKRHPLLPVMLRFSLCSPCHMPTPDMSLQLCSRNSLLISRARYATVWHSCPHLVTWQPLYRTERRRTKRQPMHQTRITDFNGSDVTWCAQPVIKRDINGNVKTWLTTAGIELSISVCKKQWEIKRSVTQRHNCPHSPSYKCVIHSRRVNHFFVSHVSVGNHRKDNRGTQKLASQK